MPVHQKPERPTHELAGARFTSLASPSTGSVRNSVWRVDLSPGTPATPHQLTVEEVLVVLAGRARVSLAGRVAEATTGDCIVVPPDTTFSLEAMGEEPFSALCCFPVGGRARLSDGNEFTPPWAE